MMIPLYKGLCIIAQPGSRLPGRALFPIVHIGDGLAVKSIFCNKLKRSKRLPGGRQALPGLATGRSIWEAMHPYAEVSHNGASVAKPSARLGQYAEAL